MLISRGILREKDLGVLEWWIEKASSTRFGICIHERRHPECTIGWREFHSEINKSGNYLALLMADDIHPKLSSPAYCGRITIDSLDDIGGVGIEWFLRFIKTFIAGALNAKSN